MSGTFTELEADIDLLLECLKCQLDSPAGLKQALLTIATMCWGNEAAQNYIRECRGLDYVLNLVTTTQLTEVKEAGLYALGNAIERNVFSQKRLTTGKVFEFLREALSCSQSSNRLRQTACFAILSLVANNGHGQSLVRKTECLHNLLKLFKTCLPENYTGGDGNSSNWLDKVEHGNKELWANVTSAICVCVNNPQNDTMPQTLSNSLAGFETILQMGNDREAGEERQDVDLAFHVFVVRTEENQRLCVTILPQAFQYLQETKDSSVIRSIASLVGLIVANNMNNKERVHKCGGLDVFIACLEKMTISLPNNYEDLEVAVALSSTIDNVITDNAQNTERCGELGVMPLLLKLLIFPGMEPQVKMQVVLTLGHCTDSSVNNRVRLVEQGGLAVLIQALTNASDEELARSIKYVLQTCVTVEPGAVLGQSTPQRKKMKPVVSGARRELERVKRFQAIQAQPSNPASQTYFLSDEEIRVKIFELERKLEASMELPEKNVDDSLNKVLSPQNNCQDPETEKLRQELQKERSLRKRLEMEARRAREALQEHAEKEKNARINAEALAKELEKQQAEQEEEDSKLKQQVEMSRIEHARLLELRKQKKKELKEIHSQLRKLEEETDTDFYPLELENSEFEEQESDQEFVPDHECPIGSLKNRIVSKACLVNTAFGGTKESIPQQCLRSAEANSPSEQSTHVHDVMRQVAGCNNVNNKDHVPKTCTTPSKVKTLTVGVQTPENLMSEESNGAKYFVENPKLSRGEENNCVASNSTNHELYSNIGCLKSSIHKINGQQTVGSMCQPSAPNHSIRGNGDLHVSKGCLKTCENNTPNNMLELFVKPVAPAKRSLRKSCPDSAPPRISAIHSRSFKRQLFKERPGINTNSGRLLQNISVNMTKPVSSSSGSPQEGDVHCGDTCHIMQVPSSPSPSLRSEFDLQLMRTANKSRISLNFPTDMFYSKSYGGGDTGMSGWDRASPEQSSFPTQKGDCSNALKQMNDFRNSQKKLIASSTKHPKLILSMCNMLPRKNVDFSSGNKRTEEWVTRTQEMLSLDNQNPESHLQEDFVTDEESETEGVWNEDTATTHTFVAGEKGSCPGCHPPEVTGGPLLNSRTYNIALETNNNTCFLHRLIRLTERSLVARTKCVEAAPRGRKHYLKESVGIGKEKRHIYQNSLMTNQERDVYNFTCESGTPRGSVPLDREMVTPFSTEISDKPGMLDLSKKSRRQRIPYSVQEVANLQEGVAKLGRYWTQILNTYDFHASRTAVDLKDKFKRMTTSGSCATNTSSPNSTRSTGFSRKRGQPFSMVEERRLRRGVRLYGYHWKSILNTFKFTNGRTAEELRSKWRNMNKNLKD